LQFDVRIGRPGDPGQKTRRVELARDAGRVRWMLDGREIEADAVEIAPATYSILLEGRSLEVRVQPAGDAMRIQAGGEEFLAQVLDPRAWRGKRAHAVEVEGRQHIAAPMPGKVVRLLVKAGEKVEVGQALLVVEAMKMQNEIRAPKTGTVERLLVAEGQAVSAGDLLAVVA